MNSEMAEEINKSTAAEADGQVATNLTNTSRAKPKPKGGTGMEAWKVNKIRTGSYN